MASLRRKSVAVQQSECEGVGCSSGPEIPRFLCLSCGCTYCDACWMMQGPHKLGKVGLDGLPHEKTNEDIYNRLKAIFEPPEDLEVLKKLHIEDEDTTWFGIDKDDNGRCYFQDNGRFAALMSRFKQPGPGERYPLLVSFVGQTGAGKSTLIKMLVSLMEQKLVMGTRSMFESPVAGSVKNDKSPTSGDVHLYIDPSTAFSEYPVLYADCEGLEGGEVPPRAARIREALRKTGYLPGDALFGSKPREVKVPATKSEAGTREWAVKHIYPRLLYTFSDAVVFVLRNTRTFESTALSLLLEWAATSLEASINQPVLPHAIIVLNASNATIDQEEWDSSVATERLMDHVKDAIFNVPQFRKYADTWKRRGQKIESTLDLIRCYYADIRVVRVPTKGRYMLASDQISSLHREIAKACDTSFKAKMDAHLISNTDQLNKYLQAGFDHFTNRPDEPFNFITAAFRTNPIPVDFGDHILNAATELFGIANINYLVHDGTELFTKLSYIIAACISIDCVSHRRPGKPDEIFDQYYAASCSAAWNRFCDWHLGCNFVSKKGKHCCNTSSNHEKGHQSERGKIIGVGAFIYPPGLDEFCAVWLDMIRQHLVTHDAQLQEKRRANRQSSWSDHQLAYELHRERLSFFYSPYEKTLRGLYTCYSCLMEVPQHPLPCEHFICTNCLKAFGRATDKQTVTMDFCPLHSTLSKMPVPCTIRFKPEYAGVRVLSLDGGGIRGIVELEMLRAIEKALGGSLPIQIFFDLIVGTSAGGLIALALGAKEWSLEQCLTQFIGLTNQAFSAREFAGIAGLGRLTQLRHKSKYKTKPLRDGLKAALGEEYLYGAARATGSVYDIKVAVTATSGTGETAIVLGNYNRQEEFEWSYDFQNDHNLQIWQAASATSAAPLYFKPFEVQDTLGGAITYLDGAIYYNNPVRIANAERRFLWPDVADSHPDILLSLGTGKNGRLIEAELRKGAYGDYMGYKDMYPRQGRLSKLKAKAARRVSKKKSPQGLVSRYFDVAVNRLDNIFDAEREFDDFYNENLFFGDSDMKDRYIRLNVDVDNEPPALDEKDKMPALQHKTQAILNTPNYQLMIATVARKLIASTFYFDKDDKIEHDERTQSYTCKGRVACRFEGSSSEMQSRLRNLGNFLRSQRSADFQQYFTVKEKPEDMDDNKVEITTQALDALTSSAEFRLAEGLSVRIPSRASPTTVFLAFRSSKDGQAELYPISGFPRYLLIEDSVTEKRLEQRAELIKARKYNASLIANDLFIEDYMNAIENDMPFPDIPGLPPLPPFPGIPPFDDDEATLISSPRPRPIPSMPPSLLSSTPSLRTIESTTGLHRVTSGGSTGRSSNHSRFSPLQALDEFESMNERYKESRGYTIIGGGARSVSTSDIRQVPKHTPRDSGIDVSPIPSTSDFGNDAANSHGAHRVVSGPAAIPTLSSQRTPRSPTPPSPIRNMMVVDAEELFEQRHRRSSPSSNGFGGSREEFSEPPMTKAMVRMALDEDSDSDGPPSDYESAH